MNVAVVAAALAEFEPDVLLLQEVQRDQLGALGSALQTTEARWRFKHWPVRVPAEGLGVLSQLPLVDVRVQVLAHRWSLWNWRRRIAVHVGVVVGDRMIRVVNTHLGAGVSAAERSRQAEALLEVATAARVIAGDLNAEPGAVELVPFGARGYVDAERSLHAGVPGSSTNWKLGPRDEAPTQRLDYLMVQPDVIVLTAFVPEDHQRWAPLSDHLPVIARLRV